MNAPNQSHDPVSGATTSRPGRNCWSCALIWSIGLAMVVSIGLAAWAATQALRPAPRPLRVAINPWPGYEFASLARAKGFFEQEGVDVRLLELSGLGDCVRAFEREQVDGFFGTVTEVLRSRDQSRRDAQVVMVADYSDGADVILARPDIATVAELRGKRIGIETGSLTAFILARALEEAGLGWLDVRTVHMAAMDMAAAMAERKVDAVVTYPPLSLEIVKCGHGREIFSTRAIPGEVVDVLAFDESCLKTRGDEVRGFLRAFHRAQEYAAAHPAESMAIMAAREGITPEEFAAALTNGVRMLGQADQARFLGREGSLRGVVVATDRILRQIGQVSDPQAARGVLATFGEDRGD
ncbi:MAG: ABC transporter substrate-binding protein [Phycisphaerae bacterium]